MTKQQYNPQLYKTNQNKVKTNKVKKKERLIRQNNTL